MYVPGDAAATAGNVVDNEGLVRLGVVSDLVNEVLLVLLAARCSPSSITFTSRRPG